jgi:hypothetical protein
MRPRSCGSTLKPFVYLAAIDRHLLTAASLLPDTAEAIRDEYRITNRQIAPQSDGRFFWQVAPGQWNIRAVGPGGIAEETIFVE